MASDDEVVQRQGDVSCQLDLEIGSLVAVGISLNQRIIAGFDKVELSCDSGKGGVQIRHEGECLDTTDQAVCIYRQQIDVIEEMDESLDSIVTGRRGRFFQRVEIEGVCSAAARHRVPPFAASDDIVTTVSSDRILERVPDCIDIAGTSQDQLFDICTEPA